MGPYWQVFAHISFTERFAHVKSKISLLVGSAPRMGRVLEPYQTDF